jgi:hypothetical protein
MPGVWFGTGWAQAEDRLFQIELVRRNARGSLAELFRAIDSSTIAQDKQSLTLYTPTPSSGRSISRSPVGFVTASTTSSRG